MVFLSSGVFENTIPISGVRPTTNLAVEIFNSGINPASVTINGFYVSGGTAVQYVLEVVTINPNEVLNRDYYAEFDNFVFDFEVSSHDVDISLWGESALGDLVASHRALPAELKENDSCYYPV